ncbi:MAG: hypothetical protein ACR2RF_23600 [Geminicoccaceae bacterium]
MSALLQMPVGRIAVIGAIAEKMNAAPRQLIQTVLARRRSAQTFKVDSLQKTYYWHDKNRLSACFYQFFSLRKSTVIQRSPLEITGLCDFTSESFQSSLEDTNEFTLVGHGIQECQVLFGRLDAQ